jgi:3D (Asp-Asp-Asp) domain-containing protein
MTTLIASALVAGFFIMSGANAASAPEAPALPTLPSYSVTLTSYNAVVGQTDGDPMTTASGLRSNPDVIAARSVDMAGDLPFGTVVALTRSPGTDTATCGFNAVEPLIGYRVIGDSMNSRFTNRVDVLLDQNDTVISGGLPKNPSRVLGVCDDVTVQVVGFMNLSDVPSSQEELAAMVAAGETSTSEVAAR